MVKQLACGFWTDGNTGAQRSWPLIAEFLDYLRQAGSAESGLAEFSGPAKHFLVWIAKRRIRIDAVDIDVVRQFLTHDCNCPRPSGERYQNRHLRRQTFKARVLQFVRFLEDTGRIHNPASLKDGRQRIAEFTAYLSEQDYAPATIKSYEHSCSHFVVWLCQERVSIGAIDENVMRRFATHDCLCPGTFV